MPKLQVATDRKCLDFATDLRMFAKRKAPSPRIEDMVHALAARIQREHSMSKALKREKIVAFMRSEHSGELVSRREIEDFFHWHRCDVADLMAGLVGEDRPRVEEIKQQMVLTGTRGGRPATRYRLTRLGFATPKT